MSIQYYLVKAVNSMVSGIMRQMIINSEKYCLLTVISLTMIIVTAGCRVSERNKNSAATEGLRPVVIDDRNIVGDHVTTRPHNRKVIYHAAGGYWYVFYGHGGKDPDGKHRVSWRSSKDGINWSERYTAFEGGSHSSSLDVMATDDKITALIFRPDYYRERANVPEERNGILWFKRQDHDFYLPYEISQYYMSEGDLIPGPVYPVMGGTSYEGLVHYGSLTQDSDGFFWVGGRMERHLEKEPFEAWVSRSSKANDISKWEPHIMLYRAAARGTVAVQVVALDGGKIFAVIYSKSDVKIFGSLYDPKTGRWEKPYVITEGNAESKRAVAAFDPGTNRLHLVYIDNSGALRHKILSHPYEGDDWSPKAGNGSPGFLIDSNVVTKIKAGNDISLSVDTSKVPAHLVVAYQKETPHYRIRWYDGKEWGTGEFQIGIQEPDRYTDEISLIRDYSDQLGLIYYVKPDMKRKGEVHFLKIPKDIFQDNKN